MEGRLKYSNFNYLAYRTDPQILMPVPVCEVLAMAHYYYYYCHNSNSNSNSNYYYNNYYNYYYERTSTAG